jgi:hypothetical protein
MKLLLAGIVLVVGGGLLWLGQVANDVAEPNPTEITIPLEVDESEILPNPQGDVVQKPGEFSGQENGATNLQETAILGHEDLEKIDFVEE